MNIKIFGLFFVVLSLGYSQGYACDKNGLCSYDKCFIRRVALYKEGNENNLALRKELADATYEYPFNRSSLVGKSWGSIFDLYDPFAKKGRDSTLEWITWEKAKSEGFYRFFEVMNALNEKGEFARAKSIDTFIHFLMSSDPNRPNEVNYAYEYFKSSCHKGSDDFSTIYSQSRAIVSKIDSHLEESKEAPRSAPDQKDSSEYVPCIRDIQEFRDTGVTVQSTSSKGNIHDDLVHPNEQFVIRHDPIDAYASTVFQFLLKEHSQDVCFIRSKDNISVAVRVEPTFQHADEYHNLNRMYSDKPIHPILPPGSGLGRIIVASALLGEANLKGLNSDKSNLGIITKDGKKIYYKSKSGQAFTFNWQAYDDSFDLRQFMDPKRDMPFLAHLGLSEHVTDADLAEMKAAAIEFSRIPKKQLESLLNVCEEEVTRLGYYPGHERLRDDHGNNGVFKDQIPPKTFKEAVLRRFELLGKVMKDVKADPAPAVQAQVASPAPAPLRAPVAHPKFVPCSRKMEEFKDTGVTLGNSGSRGNVYIDLKDPTEKFLIKEDVIEAYASTVFHYLLGKHSQDTCFIQDQGKVYAAIRMEPTFEAADEYHNPYSMYPEKIAHPFLPHGSGLAPIVVASAILGESDLKGLSSDRSNLGIIKKDNEEIYYKIDSGQAFTFNWLAYNKSFDLTQFKTPKSDSNYIQVLGLSSFVSEKDLMEMQEAAHHFAAIPDKDLEEVLDFCEAQIKILPKYPHPTLLANEDGSNTGVFQGDPAPKTFKEAIMRRFKQLRHALQ